MATSRASRLRVCLFLHDPVVGVALHDLLHFGRVMVGSDDEAAGVLASLPILGERDVDLIDAGSFRALAQESHRIALALIVSLLVLADAVVDAPLRSLRSGRLGCPSVPSWR
jgi:hypothetical protein